MALTDPEDFREFLSRLDRDHSDDVAFVSAVAHRGGERQWSLLYGSVLLGPPDMALSSWLDWRQASGDAAAGQVGTLLQQQGLTLHLFADFAAVDGEWLIARRPLSGTGSATKQIGQWLTELTGGGDEQTRRFPRREGIRGGSAAGVAACWRVSRRPLVSWASGSAICQIDSGKSGRRRDSWLP
jgi:hypothetical protein